MKKINIDKKYKTLVEHLRLVCKSLRWKLAFDTDLKERFDVEDGIAFTIDEIEYVVCFFDGQKSDKIQFDNGYYVSTTVQYPGNHEEPSSEDEVVLTCQNSKTPEALINTIVKWHWGNRFQWAMEALYF